MTVHTQDCKFWIADEVTIDNDKEMHGVVTEVLFKANDHVTYSVSWLHNGTCHSAWVEEFRLSERKR